MMDCTDIMHSFPLPETAIEGLLNVRPALSKTRSTPSKSEEMVRHLHMSVASYWASAENADNAVDSTVHDALAHSTVVSLMPRTAVAPCFDFSRFGRELSEQWGAELPVVGLLDSGNAEARRGVWAARGTVAAYAALEDDWDGNGAEAPDGQDVDNAVETLDLLADAAAEEPHTCAGGDGEIALEWQLANNGYLDVFLQDGELAFIFRSPSGDKKNGECAFDDADAKNALIGEIRQLMVAHSGAGR